MNFPGLLGYLFPGDKIPAIILLYFVLFCLPIFLSGEEKNSP
jgi:hypothetical protein